MVRFLSKVAFLLNIAFLLACAIHYIPSAKHWDQDWVSTIVVTAYFIAIPVNILFNGIILFFLIKKNSINIDRWLIIVNFIILVLQGLYFQFT